MLHNLATQAPHGVAFFIACSTSARATFTVLFETFCGYYRLYTRSHSKYIQLSGDTERNTISFYLKPKQQSSPPLPYKVLDQCRLPFFLRRTLRKCRMESSSKKRDLQRIKYAECLFFPPHELISHFYCM